MTFSTHYACPGNGCAYYVYAVGTINSDRGMTPIREKLGHLVSCNVGAYKEPIKITQEPLI
jgi:hypothetical protein